MARQRENKADNWMPPGVRLDKKGNRYIVRSRKLTDGKEQRLCGPKATRSQVWSAYEALSEQTNNTLDDLCGRYLKSQKYIDLSPSTQELYRHCRNSLKKITFNEGSKFLDLPPQRASAGILRQILDLRASQGCAVMGNREIKGFLSAVYSWAIERDMIKGLTANPCHSVKRNKETPRDRYVTDYEYNLAMKHAGKPWLELAMELSFLLYARISEVLELTRQDIKDEGIYVKRKKGSKSNLVTWSPRLRETIKKAKDGDVKCIYVLHNGKGKRITYGMLRKPWDKMMADASKENPDFVVFTRHDLKAKGISDQVKIQNSAGHRSPEIQEQYKRKLDHVDPAK